MKVEYINHMGDDTQVVMAARVSFSADRQTRSEEDNVKLIKYLAQHNHWSPFAHTFVTLRITAPVPIRTQCFKHKVGFVENEESRRYVSYDPVIFAPRWRHSVTNKKQGSGDTVMDLKKISDMNQAYFEATNLARKAYEKLLEAGVAEEQARFVLPQGVMVNWYWSGSVASFARFCKQRMDPHAQLEIQQLATMVAAEIKELYPVSWAALMEE